MSRKYIEKFEKRSKNLKGKLETIGRNFRNVGGIFRKIKKLLCRYLFKQILSEISRNMLKILMKVQKISRKPF